MNTIPFRKIAETEGLEFAKAIFAGEAENTYTKADWRRAIEKYGEERFTDPKLTKEQRFSKAMDILSAWLSINC